MAIYQKTLDNTVVAINAASSPGTGWSLAATLQAVLNSARTANMPLFLRAGTYSTGALDVTTGTGGGKPLELLAEPGTVTISLSGTALHLLQVDGVADVTIRGIIFNGNNQALTGSGERGLVRFVNAGAINFSIENSVVLNSTAGGIVIDGGAKGRITSNRISACVTGIFANDSVVDIEGNQLSTLGDNGIAVWTSSIAANGSTVRNNIIDNVNNASGGTGQYGNAILVFRAGNVKVVENTISNVRYSAVRLNATSNSTVANNFCKASREVAIFVEAPASGLNTNGCVIAGNVIDDAGCGVSIANAGLYGDGITSLNVVSGNVVRNITKKAIPDPGYSPPTTTGGGIGVEHSTEVTGNLITATQGAAITLGTNDAAINLAAVGNTIISCPMGIGYSANGAARSLLIGSNLIRGYRNISNIADPLYPVSGAIVSQSFNGTSYDRDTNGAVANADYGNSTQTSVGNLTVGMNRANV